MKLAELQSAVRGELDELEQQLSEALVSHLPLIRTVADHLLLTRGKRFRPTLLLLSAKMSNSPPSEAIRAATVVELIHTATLIHDDSIDKSELRRGVPTVNFKWDDDVSIAMGDFLYSKAFYLLVSNGMYETMDILAEATHRMSVGEMLEIERRDDVDVTEDDYMTMITEKTASLMSASCEIGAVLGDTQDGARGYFSRFGHAVGLAFQITDDLFDFMGREKELGKEIGSDVRGGKFTLPLIAALRNATSRDRARIHKILKSGSLMDGNWQELLTLIDEYDGIRYSRERAFAYAAEAKDVIKRFEGSPCYPSLCSAVDYTVERKR
ncbi:MAG: polyprenyl synthetase family protein [Candidatus Eiseniibacteriota bacterium]|nr:MAG: polyprenyl synthetase family protein [Candidatus Eisenbacteria bacterium]